VKKKVKKSTTITATTTGGVVGGTHVDGSVDDENKATAGL